MLTLVPVFAALARTQWYRPLLLRGGSVALAAIAAVWFVEHPAV